MQLRAATRMNPRRRARVPLPNTLGWCPAEARALELNPHRWRRLASEVDAHPVLGLIYLDAADHLRADRLRRARLEISDPILDPADLSVRVLHDVRGSRRRKLKRTELLSR